MLIMGFGGSGAEPQAPLAPAGGENFWGLFYPFIPQIPCYTALTHSSFDATSHPIPDPPPTNTDDTTRQAALCSICYAPRVQRSLLLRSAMWNLGSCRHHTVSTDHEGACASSMRVFITLFKPRLRSPDGVCLAHKAQICRWEVVIVAHRWTGRECPV